MKKIAIAAALLVLGVGAAFAQTYKVGDIEVAHPWAPPMTGPKLTNSAA
jgi:copper(I)-binding protein